MEFKGKIPSLGYESRALKIHLLMAVDWPGEREDLKILSKSRLACEKNWQCHHQ